jgi:hypothetical protein
VDTAPGVRHRAGDPAFPSCWPCPGAEPGARADSEPLERGRPYSCSARRRSPIPIASRSGVLIPARVVVDSRRHAMRRCVMAGLRGGIETELPFLAGCVARTAFSRTAGACQYKQRTELDIRTRRRAGGEACPMEWPDGLVRVVTWEDGPVSTGTAGVAGSDASTGNSPPPDWPGPAHRPRTPGPAERTHRRRLTACASRVIASPSSRHRRRTSSPAAGGAKALASRCKPRIATRGAFVTDARMTGAQPTPPSRIAAVGHTAASLWALRLPLSPRRIDWRPWMHQTPRLAPLRSPPNRA